MRKYTALLAVLAVWALAANGAPASAQPGTVWAWGYNFEGELGTGYGGEEYLDNPLPVQSYGITEVIAVDAGDYHTLALMSDGTLGVWGNNEFGQLGDGTGLDCWYPIPVAGLTNVVAIAAGHRHNLALMSDGTVWAWGENWGQVGDGTIIDRPVPVQVHGPGDVGFLTDVVAIAAGDQHSLAIRSDGTVWAWGRNWSGRLGDGTKDHRLAPVQVVGLTDIAFIAAGINHSLAVGRDGRVWAWGGNSHGQLGNGTTDESWVPVEVPGLTDIDAVTAGYWCSLALKSDGTLLGWGSNYMGQLGDGTTDERWSPVAVVGLTGVTGLSTNDYHSLARRSDGTVWSWGPNGSGELGDGTYDRSLTPIQVHSADGAGYLTGVGAVGAGYAHSVAALSDNAVPVADSQSISATPGVPKPITLTGSDGNGDPLTYRIFWGPAHGTLSGTPPNVTYTSDDTNPETDSFRFRVSDGQAQSLSATVTIDMRQKVDTTLYTINRTGTITETVTLRSYDLKRTSDQALLEGKTISFKIDGTEVGTSATDAGGDALLNWAISDGPGTRTITVEFAGDGAYNGSNANATLTARSWTTKMVSFDRTAMITDRTELKARLLRSDNVPLYNKSINFYVDGSLVIARATNVDGYAGYPFYTVPAGDGAGTRTILSEWVGNGGYQAISKNATLTVLRALPYIWVLPKSVPQGAIANLYAYFRRLYDYQKQPGKAVEFLIDGTLVQGVTTDENGVARYLYRTVEPVGSYTIRCQFAGDAWVEAGAGQGALTIY